MITLYEYIQLHHVLDKIDPETTDQSDKQETPPQDAKILHTSTQFSTSTEETEVDK